MTTPDPQYTEAEEAVISATTNLIVAVETMRELEEVLAACDQAMQEASDAAGLSGAEGMQRAYELALVAAERGGFDQRVVDQITASYEFVQTLVEAFEDEEKQSFVTLADGSPIV